MSKTKSFPRTMQAVFLEKHGGPLVVREVEVPEPGSGEVLVKISAAPVNFSDIAMIRYLRGVQDLTTFIPGREGSGRVVAAGKGLLPRIWMEKRVACSPAYQTSGTWAEYMITKAGLCFPLSSKISDEQGSMSMVNPLTALAFFEKVKENRHKAIINNAAAGALGRMIEWIGNDKRIPVINIVRDQKQSDSLTGSGSPYVLDSSSPAFIDDLGRLAGKLQATALFDPVCSRQLEKMIEVLPAGSSVFIYGNLSGEKQIQINPRSLIDNDITIKGFYLGKQAKENGVLKNLKNLREVSRLMSSGMKINIRARYKLSNAQEAVDDYLSNMSAGKVILVG
jgi:NADPH:quinone reductase